ncbi:MAG: undecaprenyl diphosphate synthase family protein [Clostridia bacterium]|nr:undecaprenyl diphosphate synthase family protein [Clostridia bacterium]
MEIKHLGIIPDGNRRWARENNVTYEKAYDLFSNHICNIIKEVNKNNIEMLTFYVVSKENLKRNNSDVFDVLQSVKNMLQKKLPSVAKQLNIQVKCIGIDSVGNDELIEAAKYIESFCKTNTGMTVNLLIGYNPFDEINDIVCKGQKISIHNLSVPQYVDVLIRTAGGPVRLSNFLPLQCGYANIEVMENKFLDVKCEAIISAFKKYKNVNPNYGK